MTVVVTAEPFDDEMIDRIERHRADRPDGWRTVEAPFDLVEAVEFVPDDHVLLVDCVTVWLGNLMVRGDDGDAIERAGHRLAAAVRSRKGPCVIVSNEVGLGIVPADPMSRSFRDVQGRTNAALAESVDHARFVVAGRLLALERLEDLLGDGAEGGGVGFGGRDSAAGDADHREQEPQPAEDGDRAPEL